MTEGRLDRILAEQTRLAGKRREKEAKAQTAADSAALLREDVERRWAEIKEHLDWYVKDLNGRMKKNEVALVAVDQALRDSKVGASPRNFVGRMDIFHAGDEHNKDTLRRATITVQPDGGVQIRVNTRSHAPIASRDFNILDENSQHAFEEGVLDFLEHNPT